MKNNPNKAVSANSRGIVVYFRDINRHHFLPYSKTESHRKPSVKRTSKPKIQIELLNKKQQEVYGPVVYGLSFYGKEVVKTMSEKTKHDIAIKYTKAQKVLNRLKQEIVGNTVDDFLQKLFPHSRITQVFIQTKGYDKHIKDVHSFRELGINQKVIAKKLVEANLLPENFFELV